MTSAESSREASLPEPDAVCVTCRFGRGEERSCVLLEKGEHDLLFSEGPCRLDAEVRRIALHVIRKRYPFAKSMEEDVASDALLRVLGNHNLLVPEHIHHLPVLRRRLREVVRNAVIDALRHHKLVTRIRCGACSNFDQKNPPPGCHLQELPDLGTARQPNPWYGDKVEHKTDPRRLDPPCDVFSWRRPETHDIFEEDIPGMSENGSSREQSINLLVQAIDRVAQEDDRGMHAAAALFWHYLRGKAVKVLAKESAVSEKTIKRLLSEGRERLLAVLQDSFGVTNLGELL